MGVPPHRVLIVDPSRRLTAPAPEDAAVVTETVASVAEAARRLWSQRYDAVLLRVDDPGETSLLLRIRTAYPDLRVIAVSPDEGRRRKDPLLERCDAVVREGRELVEALLHLREKRARLMETALGLADPPIHRLVPFVVDRDGEPATHLRRAFGQLRIPFPHPVAATSREAMERLEPCGDPLPTMVMLDLELPDDSAFELLSWMKPRPAWAGVPVFALSSSLAPRRRHRALDLGAKGYFSKPTFPGEHVEVIKVMVVRWAAALRGTLPAPEREPSARTPRWLRAGS